MRKTVSLLLFVACACVSLFAQPSVWVYGKNGTNWEFPLSETDSISFIKPADLRVFPKRKTVPYWGQTFTIKVFCKGAWNAECSQSWVQLNPVSGQGDGVVTVTVDKNVTYNPDKSNIWFYSQDESPAVLEVDREAREPLPCTSHTDLAAMTLTDCQCNTYKIVKIGDQYWMAENLRVTEYDTQSPYFSELIDESLLYDGRQNVDEYTAYLTDEMRSKLGLFYHWNVAARGEITFGNSILQGICPNGWHISDYGDYLELIDFIEGVAADYDNTSGKYLKSIEGWYKDDSNYKQGLDSYGFNALPSGYYSSYNNQVVEMGKESYYWMTYDGREYYSPESFHERPCGAYMYYGWDILGLNWDLVHPEYLLSVRCVKDKESVY